MKDYSTYDLKSLISEYKLLQCGTELSSELGIESNADLIKENKKRMDAIEEEVKRRFNGRDIAKFYNKTNKEYNIYDLLPKYMHAESINIPYFDLKEPTRRDIKDVLPREVIETYQDYIDWINFHFNQGISEHPRITKKRRELNAEYYEELGRYTEQKDEYEKRYGHMKEKKKEREYTRMTFFSASLSEKPKYLPQDNFLRLVIEYQIEVLNEIEKEKEKTTSADQCEQFRHSLSDYNNGSESVAPTSNCGKEKRGENTRI